MEKRRLSSSTTTELAKLVNEIGIADVAREIGFTQSAIHKMIRDNSARPVVENWARLYREARSKEPHSEHEIVICRVDAGKAPQLLDFVTLVLKGRALRFTER